MQQEVSPAGAEDPRSVSRGLKLRTGFLGIDSLYLIVEYPHADVYERWLAEVDSVNDPLLNKGIVRGDVIIKKGLLGYKLSIWDGDARMFVTDRVTSRLRNSPTANQGMGVMLQLGPRWLLRYGDVVWPDKLRSNIYAQLIYFGLNHPEDYSMRINRLDLTLDVIGLKVSDFSVDEWREQWVGYASQKTFHDASATGKLEGLSIGSSQGAVRFKVYDKEAESIKRGTSRFWHSVWQVDDYEPVDVARFEWSVKCFEARFTKMRYLSDFTFEGFLALLNYVTLKWGQLRLPQEDTNQSRWPMAPLWQELRALIDDWSFEYEGTARRDYDYRRIDLKRDYLRSITGWIGGLMARVAVHNEGSGPVALGEALAVLENANLSVDKKAQEKYELYSKMAGRK